MRSQAAEHFDAMQRVNRSARRRQPACTASRDIARVLPAIVLLALLVAPPVGAQWNRSHPRVLLVTQTQDTPAGAAVQSAVLASIGFARDALTALPGHEAVPAQAAGVQLLLAELPAAATQAHVIAIASQRYAEQAPVLASRLAAHLRSLGASRALFVLDQATMLSGETDPRRLVWTLTADANGRFTHSSPALHTRHPTLLHVRYVPFRLASGLPPGWRYLEAGRLAWQRVTLQLQPAAPVQSVDTAGAFDAPLAADGARHDPDAGLGCLVDRRSHAGCAAGFPDVVGLIDTQGAAWALVDYVRELAPVYDSQPALDGRIKQAARAGLAVTRREVAQTGCTSGITYRNVGQLGVLLEAITDRVHVTPGGRSAPIARFSDLRLSPTHDYDHTRPVGQADPLALAPLIIDPLVPAGDLVPAASAPGLRELAPIERVGGPPSPHVRWLAPAGDLARTDVEVSCPEPGRWVARSTIAPWSRCYGGGCNSTYFPRELSFTQGRAAVADWAWTAYTYRGSPWEPQRIEYDGADTLSFQHIGMDPCGSVLTLRLSLSTRLVGMDPPPPCLSD